MLGSWPFSSVIIRIIIIILLLFLFVNLIIAVETPPGRERVPAKTRPAPPVFEWKGCQGHARKPHAERSPQGEHRTGEDVGEAAPLMPLERPKPSVWGAVKEAKRPAACIPDDRGRLAPLAGEGRGGVVRRSKNNLL